MFGRQDLEIDRRESFWIGTGSSLAIESSMANKSNMVYIAKDYPNQQKNLLVVHRTEHMAVPNPVHIQRWNIVDVRPCSLKCVIFSSTRPCTTGDINCF